MSGADDVTVVWIAPAEGRDDAARALVEWGRARGIALSAAGTLSAPGALRASAGIAGVAERVEREIDRAREAIAALDADATERALARAEASLRDHPELPQAAWLRAEVNRTWASRFMRIEPRDEARARAAWQDADALDGGRTPGIGEAAFPPRPSVAARIVVHGPSAGRALVVRVDGAPVAPRAGPSDARASLTSSTYALETPPAEHHVVVTIDGDAVFASWVAIAAAGAIVELSLAGGGSCDAMSFAGVQRVEASRVEARGVSCERWVAAIPGERRGSVLVARCERDACGPLLEWRTEGIGPPAAPQPDLAPRTAWPAWATWTLLGVGAATATTLALVATGALESRPSEQRFVAGGVKVESHRP